MVSDLYELQARCERIAAQARKADSLEKELERARRSVKSLRATLTAERIAHEGTRNDLRVMGRMAGAMARRIHGESIP